MEQSSKVHPSAVVHAKAQLSEGVVVGPFCVIGENVKIGAGTVLHSHVVIEGHTSIGNKNEIFPFASIGHAPQDLKYRNEPTLLEIGDSNKIRECVTLQPGTVQDKGVTRIGNGNLFMAYTHVAHDCIVGNQNVFANAMQLAGHVVVGNQCVIGALSGIHQFCQIGDLAMLAAGSKVTHDIPPFTTCQGDRAVLRGLNAIGLKRKGYTSEDLQKLKQAYRILFLEGHATLGKALEVIKPMNLLSSEAVVIFCDFVEKSTRGVTRPEINASLAED
jgi:UDP-N-acetylglucosamine acyltransferase